MKIWFPCFGRRSTWSVEHRLEISKRACLHVQRERKRKRRRGWMTWYSWTLRRRSWLCWTLPAIEREWDTSLLSIALTIFSLMRWCKKNLDSCWEEQDEEEEGSFGLKQRKNWHDQSSNRVGLVGCPFNTPMRTGKMTQKIKGILFVPFFFLIFFSEYTLNDFYLI